MKKIHTILSAWLDMIEIILLHLFFLKVVACFYQNWPLSHFLEMILLGVMPVCAILAIKSNRRTRRQILIIDLFVMLFWILGWFCKETDKSRESLIYCGFICIFFSVCLLLVFEWKEHPKKLRIDAGIGILIIVFILLSIETIKEIPIYDGGVYYAWSIAKLSPAFDFTLDSIFNYCLASHISVGYGLLMLIGELVYPYSTIGVHIVNITLAAISIGCFYGILKEILPNKSKNILLSGTAVYAFCPYLLGMIGLINIDNPCLPLFIILCYNYVKNYWIFYTLLSWIFVFTKEPCLIYYLFFELGIWLYYIINYCKTKRKKLDRRAIIVHILNLLFAVYFYLYFQAPGRSSWVAQLNNMLTGNSTQAFGFSIDNLKLKLQEIFLFNFNWIVVLCCISAMLLSKLAREQLNRNLAYYLPLSTAMLGVLLFNIFYITYPHPRYIVIGEAMLLLFAIPILVCISYKNIEKLVLICIMVVFAIESFVTVDPYTICKFYPVKKDNAITNMINVAQEGAYNDSAFYNREYSYYIKLLEKTLKAANYDEDMVIVFSYYEDIPWAYGYENRFLWNINGNGFQTNETEDTIPVNIASQIYPELSSYKRVLYIIPFYADEEEEIKKRILISNEGYMKYRTMDLKYYIGYPAEDE